MTRALVIALVVAAANTAGGRWLSARAKGDARKQAWLETGGLLARVTVILGAAHWLWRTGGRAGEVVAFFFTAAIAQMTAQIWLLLKSQKTSKG